MQITYQFRYVCLTVCIARIKIGYVNSFTQRSYSTVKRLNQETNKTFDHALEADMFTIYNRNTVKTQHNKEHPSHLNFSSGEAYEDALARLKHADAQALEEQSFEEEKADSLFKNSATGYSSIDSLDCNFCSRIKDGSEVKTTPKRHHIIRLIKRK